MSTQPNNLQQHTEAFDPKDATRSVVLRTQDAVVVMDFFGTTVTQHRDAIRTSVDNSLRSGQFTTLDRLQAMVEEANSQVYQVRPSGANQGGSIVMATVAPASAQSSSMQFLVVAYGDCRIWRLRKKTVTLLYSGQNASYLGGFHLNSRDLFLKSLPFEVGDRLLLTTKRTEEAIIESHAEKASKSLLHAIGRSHQQDVLGLVDSAQIEGSLVAASQQIMGNVASQVKPLVLDWRLQVLALVVCALLALFVFRRPLVEMASKFFTIDPTATPIVPTNINTPTPSNTLTPTVASIPTNTEQPIPAPTSPPLTTFTAIPTANATNTAIPTATPLPTNTSTSTPTPVPSFTFTLVPPTPEATGTFTDEIICSNIDNADGLRVELTAPDDMAQGATETFSWVGQPLAEKTLPQNESSEIAQYICAYEVVFAVDPNLLSTEQGSGFGGHSFGNSTEVNLGAGAQLDETYYWGVRLVQIEPNFRPLRLLSQVRQFKYVLDDNNKPVSEKTDESCANKDCK